MGDAIAALERADFDWVRTLDSVWSDAEPAAGGPNEPIAAKIAADLARDARELTDRPIGRVLVGQAGIGKTHLVGRLRREVWAAGGTFVLLDVLGLQDFWRSAALSFLTALQHERSDGRTQLEIVLAGVARRFKIEEQVEAAFSTPSVDPVQLVDVMQRVLPYVDRAKAMEHGDVFRALCFLRSKDYASAALSYAWLQGYEADPERRATLGFFRPPPDPARLVAGMSWIMGIAGPILVALDQIDGVIDASRLPGEDGLDAGQGLAEVLAAGLVELHDVRHRGMTVMTCLNTSWDRLKARGTQPLIGRFMPPVALLGMNDANAAAGLVAGRLAPAFAEVGFAPPYPTWPYRRAAIDAAAAAGIMPRTLLMRCDAFRRECLARGAVSECTSLMGETLKGDRIGETAATFDLDAARRRAEAVDPADTDDAALGRLLRDAFELYASETPPNQDTDIANKGDPEQRIPPLHGRLTFTFHAENDRERHVCYRALPQTNAIAFGARLRAALTSSGISTRIAGRELVLARRGAVPGGPKTRELFGRFEAAGGLVIDPSDDDLRTFAALRDLRASAEAGGRRDAFEAWLRAERPLRATAFFRAAGLGPEQGKPEPSDPGPIPARDEVSSAEPSPRAAVSRPESASTKVPEKPRAAKPSPTAPSPPDAIPIGRRPGDDGAPVLLPLKLLPRHTAIIAGAGSGKTVLLRRMVEEAALCGIPSIVVDPNNDLSRLGDPWPERPSDFTPEDDAKARRYAEAVEVVVWTPGARAGNPLFLSVLPDFASVKDDRDECEAAVAMAAETLGPLAGARSNILKGVLSDALRGFAARGGGDLRRFTDLLADLPEGVSAIGGAEKAAGRMADELKAAVATNPLLRVEGQTLDPATLFFGPDPVRTRVSVVNLSGLASDAAREDFVNRLQMALFGWIKRHPSERGLLYVVDEAQIFLPSGREAASLGSGVRLATQARKYGLGLVVATQVPKGIDNKIVSNCTTQVFGRQSSPATIAAARDMVSAKGGTAPDIGKLVRGEFYFATEGSDRPRKVVTPLCLTHHPANPPTPEEVLERARRSRAP